MYLVAEWGGCAVSFSETDSCKATTIPRLIYHRTTAQTVSATLNVAENAQHDSDHGAASVPWMLPILDKVDGVEHLVAACVKCL